MKSGNISQFSHLSLFATVKEFNQSIRRALQLFKSHFTKKEQIGLFTLIQYSVKGRGICNARIDVLVVASEKNGGISRSTFERMQRKGKALGLFAVYPTTREKKGGDSHNVYVFQRFDGASPAKLTERPASERQATPSLSPEKKATKAKDLKATKTTKNQELRPQTREHLDYTFVPSSVPTLFVKTVKPFFNRAKEICTLWDRASMAYRSLKTKRAMTDFLEAIIHAFKATVYRSKQNHVKTSFIPYFYGTVSAMLVKKENWFRGQDADVGLWMNWVADNPSPQEEPGARHASTSYIPTRFVIPHGFPTLS